MLGAGGTWAPHGAVVCSSSVGPWRRGLCAAHVSASPRPLHPPVTFLSSASTALSTHNNSVFGDLKAEEEELLYSAYGDETGVQCALRWVGARQRLWRAGGHRFLAAGHGCVQ